MRFGVQIGVDAPTDPDELAALAARVETLGFRSLWLGDHVVIPSKVDQDSHERGVGTAKPFADRTVAPTTELLTSLAYLAGVTSTLRLGAGVLVVPLRNPVVTAKMLANVDVLSRGRLDVGVGVGWMSDEFEAVAAPPFEERGAVTNEYLDVMRRCWTAESPTFDGSYYELKDVAINPKPTQVPHPPIWVGGNGMPALRRAAAFGNGWLPLFLPPATVRERRGVLAGLRRGLGIDGPELPVAVGCWFSFSSERLGAERPMLSGSAAQMLDDVRRYEAEGCEELHLVASAPNLDPEALLSDLTRFVDDVATQVW